VTTLTLAASGLIVAVASFVMGLTGFGIGLVALAFLPLVMSPVLAIVLMTLYAAVFSVAMLGALWREIKPRHVTRLAIGTIAGTPLGVWALTLLPAAAITRLIGVMLLLITALNWWRLTPRGLTAPGWGYGAGALAGLLGGAVGIPGPPVILYAASQEWSPREMKANLLAFFVLNQMITLAGYWWTRLLGVEVLTLAALLVLPAAIGIAVGVAVFNRIDAVRFRQILLVVLFVSGLFLLLRG
jgi:uncharacterized membrane protein YfcA